jgi:hypothetical protein
MQLNHIIIIEFFLIATLINQDFLFLRVVVVALLARDRTLVPCTAVAILSIVGGL